MWKIIVFITLLSFCADSTCETYNFCAYSRLSVVKFSSLESSTSDANDDDSFITGELLDSNTTEKCPKESKYCYALWQEDQSNKSTIVILAQGCWDSSGKVYCSVDECISNKSPSKARNNTKFCCCSGNMCNVNVSDAYLPPSESSQHAYQHVEHASYNTETVIIALASVCSLAIIVVAAFLIFRLCSASSKPSPDSIHLMEAPPPSTPTLDLDNLKIQETVGRGRYGSVCRGILNNHTVAVKVFASQHKQNFCNERDIYSLPFMDHPCLLKFIGADERAGLEGRTEYLLVLSFAPLGCLQDYLRHNHVDWLTLCKMAQTITCGLAHLHTELKKGEKSKMCIAHRDMTSRNILVKSDGSCLLCDFGFAICISGSKYIHNGEEQIAETTSLTDVGTLRYMAPEVLEGAVNLRDCESSLKQIDVYALGLVLWEIATRCTDLFQGMEIPDYKLPFEAELGSHPSMDQMQVLVARHKARPLFPDIWKDTNPAVRALKETIEDCWDQDAEARLTALCVEERLLELPILWERHKAGTAVPGVSPTVNPTNYHKVLAYATQPPGNSVYKEISSDAIIQNSNREGLSPNNKSTGTSSRSARSCVSSSSETTAETSLTMSPTDPLQAISVCSITSNSNSKNHSTNNIVANCPRVTVPLQPHQGRNPCMERNLMRDHIEDVLISGNTILERGIKYNDRSTQRIHSDANIFDALQLSDNVESNSLVSNDVLSQSTRTSNPIPYLQNAVHQANTIPKQPNVPGNGHHLLSPANCNMPKRSKPFKILNKMKYSGTERKLKGLKSLLRIKKSSEQNSVTNSSCENLSPKLVDSYCTNSVLKSKISNPDKMQTKVIETEVCIISGPDDISQTLVRPVITKCPQKQLEISLQNGQDIAVESKEDLVLPLDIECADQNNYCSSSNNTGSKQKRPNTLPVHGYEYNLNICSDLFTEKECNNNKEDNSKLQDFKTRKKNNSGKEKIVNRVKTPFEIKKGRFSLYDDRIMSAHAPESCSEKSTRTRLTHLNDSAKISLSVPLDIDSLCESQAINFLQTCHDHSVKHNPDLQTEET